MSTSQDESRIAYLSSGQILEMPNEALIEIIRTVEYPFAGKERLQFFDRDTLERVVHLVRRWCQNRLHAGTVHTPISSDGAVQLLT